MTSPTISIDDQLLEQATLGYARRFHYAQPKKNKQFYTIDFAAAVSRHFNMPMDALAAGPMRQRLLENTRVGQLGTDHWFVRDKDECGID